MMGLETIRQLNRDIGRRARKRASVPKLITAGDVNGFIQGEYGPARGIPNLGPYLPKGWKRVSIADLGNDRHLRAVYMDDNEGFGAYFVDKSGFGDVGEPAFTIAEFVKGASPRLWLCHSRGGTVSGESGRVQAQSNAAKIFAFQGYRPR